ncbi:hypothetical protein D9M73_112940 [compost metagenome]
MFRRNAGARILHPHDGAALFPVCRNRQSTLRLRNGPHRVNRVHHQVEHDLLQLHIVPDDDGFGFVQVQNQHDRALVDFRRRQLQHVAHHGIQDDGFAGCGFLPGQRAKAADDVGRAQTAVLDLLQARHGFRNIGLDPLQPPDAGPGMRNDRGEWLADFMRDRCGEPAHHRKMRGLRQFCPSGTQRIFGLRATRILLHQRGVPVRGAKRDTGHRSDPLH